jgi:DsbC/DsbD-like thiol-disulfide interchange protein
MRDTQQGTKRPSNTTFSRQSAGSTALLACLAIAGLALFTAGALGQNDGRTPSGSPARVVTKTSDHLTIKAAIAPASIAAGGRIAMAIDITPKPGMHVYAPGSQYRAVTIKLPGDSPFRLEAPLEYPKPSLYTFKPLNEQVLVYDTPFKLVARVGLDPRRAVVTPLGPSDVPLAASLDYQACDDRVCYLPESMPMRWTVTLLPSRRP